MIFGVSQDLVIEVLLRTLSIGAVVSLISGALGMSLAWIVTRTQVPGKKQLNILLSVPYALPCFLLAMAWIVLGNPQVGILKELFPTEHGSYGFWGICLVLSSVAFAFPFFEIRAGFDKLDPALEEAGRMSGAGPLKVFTSISFPLLWPSLLNGMCLSFLFAVSSFGAPALLGMPVRSLVMTTLIYSQIRVGGINGIQDGLGLSLILLIVAIAVLALAWLMNVLQKKKMGPITGTKSSRPSLVNLGAFKWPVAFFAWGYFFVVVVLPWIALGISALAPIAGDYSISSWTLKNLHYVFSLSDFKEALFNSIVLSFSMATVIALVGFLLGFASVRKKQKWASVLLELLNLPFSMPGTVLAILIIVSASFLVQFGIPADQILLMMAVAYGLKYAAVGTRSLTQAFHQIHPALEESARVCGAKTGTLLRTIWFPLLKKNITACWMLAALPMFTELTMSILLTGPGGATLGTVLFELQEYADQPSAASLAWILLSVAMIIAWLTRPKEKEEKS